MRRVQESGRDEYSARNDETYESYKLNLLPEPLLDGKTAFFEMPPKGIDPKLFIKVHFGPSSKHLQFVKGTTTLAFIYEPKTSSDKGGIVVAVDSRCSAGGIITSQGAQKTLDITDNIVATMAGGAADCQFWFRNLAKYCGLYELRGNRPITVSAASKYFANMMYSYRDMGLQVGTMIAGYDLPPGGPSLYHVSGEGTRVKVSLCSVGSGSLTAYGVLDAFYQPIMTDDEALNLARRAISLAAYRDSGSGGFCNVTHITKSEKVHFDPIDVSDMMHEFREEIGRDLVYEPKDD